MKRLVLLAFVLPLACSSSNADTTDAGKFVDDSNQCTKQGGTCARNFPFRCAPGEAPATGALATACGKSEGETPVQISCCFPAVVPDTGTPDTGAPDLGSPDGNVLDAPLEDVTAADAVTSG